MGVGVGVVTGFIGIFILTVAIIIQIYVTVKQTDYKRQLEVGTVLGIIVGIIFTGSILLAAYYSGKELAEVGAKYAGEGGKFIEENPELLAA